MQPDKISQKNHLQLIISLGLVGVLVCILGGYIYIGMWQAKQVAVPVVVEEVPIVEVETPQESDRTQEILQALEQVAVPAETDNGEAILQALEEAPIVVDEERQAAILEALNNASPTTVESSENGKTQP